MDYSAEGIKAEPFMVTVQHPQQYRIDTYKSTSRFPPSDEREARIAAHCKRIAQTERLI